MNYPTPLSSAPRPLLTPAQRERERRRLYRFVFRDVVILHGVSAFAALVWAALLLIPGHLFGTNVLFAQMALRGPEWAFGLAFLAVCALDVAATRVCRAPFDLAALLPAVLAWGVVALLVANGSPPFPVWPHCLPYSTGPWIYGGLCGWIAFTAMFRAGPALGDDLSLWQSQRALRLSEKAVERVNGMAQASDRMAEASDRMAQASDMMAQASEKSVSNKPISEKSVSEKSVSERAAVRAQ